MGGGALLDVGIYCLAPLLRAAGHPPRRASAAAVRQASGVDSAFSAWLDFGDGLTGVVECALDAPERQRLELTGTRATVVVERAFTPGPDDTRVLLCHRDGRQEALVFDGADPYERMVEHVHAVARGRAAPVWTPADSLDVARLLDRLGRLAGLERRPGDGS
jgi:predicted dehydrogenase